MEDQAAPVDLYSKAFMAAVNEAFASLGLQGHPVIERPKRSEADLCLVCFSLAKEMKMSPDQAAREVQKRMPRSEFFSLNAVSGYLNCTFDPGRYLKDVARYLWSRGGDLGQAPPRGDRVIVEHTSANPNGPFHVGRARNPILGDTLTRMLRADGSTVEAQYWVNDMGKQALLLVWGMHNTEEGTLGGLERDKEDHRLVRFYQAAHARMEKNPEVESHLNRMLKDYEDAVACGEWDRTISLEGHPAVRASDVKDACERVLSGMKASLERLNVRMDSFVYESKVVEDGSLQAVIDGLKRSPLCREEGGAFYLDLSGLIEGGDDEDHRKRFVFTRSDGSALYTTRDLGYHIWKLSRCERAINVLGEDHRYQSLQLALALRELGQERSPEAMFYSFVSLPEGKMSTRRGRVVFLDDLLDEAEARAMDEVRKRRPDLPEDELEFISRMVGIGALRFNVIKVQPEKQIVFRWEDALNFEGATAPFVQYSHARACSIISKSPFGLEGDMDWSALVESSEMGLLRKIGELASVISAGAREKRVHLMALYLVELASMFNDFYRDCPVLNEKDPPRRKARLALVELSRRALAKGLWCLGIEAPRSM